MVPLQITIRDLPNSQSLENHIRERAQKLEHFFQKILNCRIVVEIPQKHKRQGKLFSVRIDLTVPGKELVSNRKMDEDVYIAIRESFIAIERQLEKYRDIRRGEVKNHESTSRGHVDRLFFENGYGFIKSLDGNEFYFNAASVLNNAFNKLMVGDAVQFFGLPTAQGLQAHRVLLEKS